MFFLELASSASRGRWAPRTQGPHPPRAFTLFFSLGVQKFLPLKPYGGAHWPPLPSLPPPPGMLPVAVAMLPANLTPSRNWSSCPSSPQPGAATQEGSRGGRGGNSHPPRTDHHGPAPLHSSHLCPKASLLPSAPSPACPHLLPFPAVAPGCRFPGAASGMNCALLRSAHGAGCSLSPLSQVSLPPPTSPRSLQGLSHNGAQPAMLSLPVLLLPAHFTVCLLSTHLHAKLPWQGLGHRAVGIASHPSVLGAAKPSAFPAVGAGHAHPDATRTQGPKEKPITIQSPHHPSRPRSTCSVSPVFLPVLCVLGLRVQILIDCHSSYGALLLYCVCNPLCKNQSCLVICLGKRLEQPQGHQDSLQKNLGRAGFLELKMK